MCCARPTRRWRSWSTRSWAPRPAAPLPMPICCRPCARSCCHAPRLITPNRREAAALLGLPALQGRADVEHAARALVQAGCRVGHHHRGRRGQRRLRGLRHHAAGPAAGCATAGSQHPTTTAPAVCLPAARPPPWPVASLPMEALVIAKMATTHGLAPRLCGRRRRRPGAAARRLRAAHRQPAGAASLHEPCPAGAIGRSATPIGAPARPQRRSPAMPSHRCTIQTWACTPSSTAPTGCNGCWTPACAPCSCASSIRNSPTCASRSAPAWLRHGPWARSCSSTTTGSSPSTKAPMASTSARRIWHTADLAQIAQRRSAPGHQHPRLLGGLPRLGPASELHRLRTDPPDPGQGHAVDTAGQRQPGLLVPTVAAAGGRDRRHGCAADA